MKTVIVVTCAALAASIGEAILSFAMKKSGQVDIGSSAQISSLVFSVVETPEAARPEK